ncbi:MAG: hypothetical protein JO323_14290 [Acidobacteriia bacterium]|nr:hypothetical protein [Terriglobia bacterium]
MRFLSSLAVLALGGTACLAAADLTAAGTEQNAPVTFSKDIARIFEVKCQECHRKGTAAPMSLITYEETRPWAKAIKERVLKRQMPPWQIDPTVGIQSFMNDRSLSDQQIATIVKWVDGGAPMGNPKDLPAPRQWPADNAWETAKLLGQPEVVVQSPEFTMPAHGQDVWWKPVTSLPITEPRWVRAVEIRPGTLAGRRITHHARADLEQDDPNDLTGDSAKGIRPAGILMEWAVGKQNDVYPADSGKLLVSGAQIRWELHIHAVGEEVRDHVELAIWLYPKGVTPKNRTVLTFFPGTPRMGGSQVLDIPPNSVTVTSGTTLLRQAARLENFQPHMHLRGKAMLMEAILPDGAIETLSFVKDFNFNWMNNYMYTPDSAPVLPKGTMIRITAWYDNTNRNPNNPDPNQWVGFGDRTIDEMSHAWVNVTYLNEDEYRTWQAKKAGQTALLNESKKQLP